MFCPHCGFMNSGDSNTCDECGRSLDSRGPSFSKPNPEADHPKFDKGAGAGLGGLKKKNLKAPQVKAPVKGPGKGTLKKK